MSENDPRRFAPPGQSAEESSWRPILPPPAPDETRTPGAPAGQVPPMPPVPAGPSAPVDPAGPPLPASGPVAPPPGRRSVRQRPTGWVWPVVAVLALVAGLIGGYAGGALRDTRDEDPTAPVAAGSDPGRVDPAPLPGDNDDVSKVATTLLPATVQIRAVGNGVANGATGSGFVLDDAGRVVTNNHVVADSAESDGPIFVVDHEGVQHRATLVGRSEVYDLAVLELDDDVNLRPAALGTSGKLQVGESVVAFGSPLGLTSTVTVGIVSALHRPVSTGDSADSASYIDAVQTDAAINPGNSGGPLVNLRGQVIGVNSAIATTGSQGGSIGVGFAIPIDQVKSTTEQIVKSGHATYPVIGAEVSTRQSTTGARVESVDPGSPAAEAGIRQGDRVVEIGGQRVSDGVSLIVIVRSHQPGDKVEFVLERGGEQRTVTVTLGAQRE